MLTTNATARPLVLFIASAFATEDSTPAYVTDPVTDPAGLTTQAGDVSQENAMESAQNYLAPAYDRSEVSRPGLWRLLLPHPGAFRAPPAA